MPEPGFDHEGFATHLFEYDYDGQRWGFEIRAKSVSDARGRIGAMTQQGEYVGILIDELPGWLPAWLIRIIFRWRQWK